MESILEKIVNSVKLREKENFLKFSLRDYRLKPDRKPVDIINLIRNNFFYIFEIKKASPSKGIIRDNFNHFLIFGDYEKAGASAISVLTEPEFFKGDKIYLKELREKTKLPLLRKDFIIHPFQIYESYNLGADFLLLIAGCLSGSKLKLLYDLTISLGMNALIEVHNEQELEKALKVSPKIIGINNRDLGSFKVDIQTSYDLKKMIPPDIFVISESGIKTHEDILKLKQNGFSGVLIGESLLKEEDIFMAAKRLINGEN
jgi:indole-3-glycerol phosphate synthase